MSFTKVDFPDPLTPVTETKTPNGTSTSISFRLLDWYSFTTTSIFQTSLHICCWSSGIIYRGSSSMLIQWSEDFDLLQSSFHQTTTHPLRHHCSSSFMDIQQTDWCKSNTSPWRKWQKSKAWSICTQMEPSIPWISDSGKRQMLAAIFSIWDQMTPTTSGNWLVKLVRSTTSIRKEYSW